MWGYSPSRSVREAGNGRARMRTKLERAHVQLRSRKQATPIHGSNAPRKWMSGFMSHAVDRLDQPGRHAVDRTPSTNFRSVNSSFL